VRSPAVDIEGVVKDYPGARPWRRGIRALSDVGLRVEPGEVVGLLGPNRAGKTTLVKVLLSLCRPTSGRVTRLGRPWSDRRTLARVGYVHENPAFPRYLSPSDLLEYYGALTLVPRGEVRRRAPALLERVGLADRAREPIARFSKGMVQRLALAQALVNQPELLVFDEPNEGLDLIGRKLVHELIDEQKKRGCAVILVSHLLEDVPRLCDRIAVLVGGKLAFCGPPGDLTREGGKGSARALDQALTALYQKQKAAP
jgi:ABC-2 type transport system ATP-binding protein